MTADLFLYFNLILLRFGILFQTLPFCMLPRMLKFSVLEDDLENFQALHKRAVPYGC